MNLSNHPSSLLYYYSHLIITAYFSVFASIEIQEIRKFFLHPLVNVQLLSFANFVMNLTKFHKITKCHYY